MIADFAGRLKRPSWSSGTSRSVPMRSASILAEFAKTPGVNVYWMGRSYLGENLWAADVTLPTPSRASLLGQRDDAESIHRLFRTAARQRSFEHQSHSEAGRSTLTRSRNARHAQAGQRGAASDHQHRWRGTFRAARRDHAEQHAASRLSWRAGRRCFHGPDRSRSRVSGIAHAAAVARSLAAGCVPESARISVA